MWTLWEQTSYWEISHTYRSSDFKKYLWANSDSPTLKLIYQINFKPLDCHSYPEQSLMLRPKHRPIIALSLRTFLMLDSTSKCWYFAQFGIFPSPTIYKLLRTCPAWTSLSSSSTQTLGTEEATLLQKIGQPLIFPHTGVSVYVLSLLQPPFSPLSHISMSVPVNSLTLCCSPLFTSWISFQSSPLLL